MVGVCGGSLILEAGLISPSLAENLSIKTPVSPSTTDTLLQQDHFKPSVS
jgi:hypothetical protein